LNKALHPGFKRPAFRFFSPLLNESTMQKLAVFLVLAFLVYACGGGAADGGQQPAPKA
jgi:hypothetical protein